MALTEGGVISAAIGVTHFLIGGLTIKKDKDQKRFAQRFKSELCFAPVISPSGTGAGMGMPVNF